nr:hypothetical protein HK105_005952 [Polyrhizophydium stewartii]
MADFEQTQPDFSMPAARTYCVELLYSMANRFTVAMGMEMLSFDEYRQFLFVFLSRASVPQGYVDPGYFRQLCDAALIKRQRFEALVRRLMWGLQIDRRLTKMSTEVEAVARFVTSLFEMTTFQFHSNPAPTQDQHDALRIMFCRFEQVALIGGKRIVPSEICDGLYDAYLSICESLHMLGTILMFCLSVSYRPGFVDFHRKAVALAVGPCVLDFGNPEVHMTDMAWRIFSTLVSNGNVIALYICGQHANTPLPAADVRTAANTGTGAAGQCDGGDSAAQVGNNARKPQPTKAAEVPDATSAINNPLATMDELAANGSMTAGMMRAFHVELDEECSEDTQHTDDGLKSDHTRPSAAELLQGSNSNTPSVCKGDNNNDNGKKTAGVPSDRGNRSNASTEISAQDIASDFEFDSSNSDRLSLEFKANTPSSTADVLGSDCSARDWGSKAFSGSNARCNDLNAHCQPIDDFGFGLPDASEEPAVPVNTELAFDTNAAISGKLADTTPKTAESCALGTQDAQLHDHDAAPVKLSSDKTLISGDEGNSCNLQIDGGDNGLASFGPENNTKAEVSVSLAARDEPASPPSSIGQADGADTEQQQPAPRRFSRLRGVGRNIKNFFIRIHNRDHELLHGKLVGGVRADMGMEMLSFDEYPALIKRQRFEALVRRLM